MLNYFITLEDADVSKIEKDADVSKNLASRRDSSLKYDGYKYIKMSPIDNCSEQIVLHLHVCCIFSS